jgi:hypothetical protein
MSEENGGGLYDQYLEDASDEVRPIAEEYLKGLSGKVDATFREAAELRKTWEPYEQVGINNYDAQSLRQFIDWREQVDATPEGFKEWVLEVAPQLGLTLQEQRQLEKDSEDASPDVQAQIEQFAAERLAPLEAWRAEQEQVRQEQTMAQDIQTRVNALKGEHGDFDEETEKFILDLGMQDMTDGWVEAGFKRYQQMIAAANREFVTEKVAQPARPETGGGYAAAEPITSFKQANELARERILHDRQA